MVARPDSIGSPPRHDQWGLRSVRVMLEDLDFPRTGKDLANRAGDWQVPMPGGRTLRLGDLLAPLGDRRFRSAEAVVKALRKEWPDLEDPQGSWPGEE